MSNSGCTVMSAPREPVDFEIIMERLEYLQEVAVSVRDKTERIKCSSRIEKGQDDCKHPEPLDASGQMKERIEKIISLAENAKFSLQGFI